MMALSRGPCDSPDVTQRRRDIVATKIAIFAKPNAKKSALVRRVPAEEAPSGGAGGRPSGRAEGGLEVTLAAPPLDGRANEELIRLLAKVLGLRKKDLEIASGEGARIKIVHVLTLSQAEADARLDAALGTPGPGG